MHERGPAVAGRFYPEDPQALRDEIRSCLKVSPPGNYGEIIGLVVPHAGYVFSGKTAAYAYSLVRGKTYDTVIVVSPSHFQYFNYISIMTEGSYRTPLGSIEIDRDLAEKIVQGSSLIRAGTEGHLQSNEHAVEVQLPFLQMVLEGDFRFVPILMSDQSLETSRELGKAIATAVEGKNVLLVASSDLSHFHHQDEAYLLDQRIIGKLEEMNESQIARLLEKRKSEACGAGAIIAVLSAAKKLGAEKCSILHYATSADTQYGDQTSVVGYVSAVLTREVKNNIKAKNSEEEDLPEVVKEELLQLAHESIRSVVLDKPAPMVPDDHPLLRSPSGAFVTLTGKKGNLRGCIGMIEPVRTLAETVVEAAKSAAVRDPRFQPVDSVELNELNIEISILSPLVKIDPEAIEPGVHGLFIKKGYRQGLLLPQVPVKYGWDRETFLEQTCIKAGLERSAWKSPDTEIYGFTAKIITEN